MCKCVAVILAGGIGQRLGDPKPKQYHLLFEKPVVIWSMLQYQLSPEIDYFIIVADNMWHKFLKEWIDKEDLHKFKGFAQPGNCRQASVRNGMLSIAHDLQENDLVCIQDGARPCCTLNMISEIIKTVKKGADGAVVSALDYEGHFRSDDGIFLSKEIEGKEYVIQSPDCYRWGKYFKIVKNATDKELLRSRGCQQIAIMHGLNIQMCLIDGRCNPKLTTKDDWEYLEINLTKVIQRSPNPRKK